MTKIHIPCWRYSASGPILVTSQDALDALGPEWVDSPAKVPGPGVAAAVPEGSSPSARAGAPAVAQVPDRPTLTHNRLDRLVQRITNQQKKGKP